MILLAEYFTFESSFLILIDFILMKQIPTAKHVCWEKMILALM